MKFSHNKFTVVGLAVALMIHATYSFADDDEGEKKRAKTAKLASQVSDFYASIPQLVVPDCPIGTGWVGPGNGLGYSHCWAAGPATTTKPRTGMTAVEVCALNSGAGYAWTVTSQSCAIPAPPASPPASTNDGGSNPADYSWNDYSGGGADADVGPASSDAASSDGASSDGASSDGGVGSDGGAGGSCFIGSTLINLGDGIHKQICDIKIGDYVLDALTGQTNKVIGVKKVIYSAGKRLYSPVSGIEPFMTEEHPYYDNSNNLTVMSPRCAQVAPWLGDVAIVTPKHELVTESDVNVFNLMLQNGISHYANGIKVSNIVGNGGVYVLLYKGYLTQEEYEMYVATRNAKERTPSQIAFYHLAIRNLMSYALNNDNSLSVTMCTGIAESIRKQEKISDWFKHWNNIINPVTV